MSLNSFPELYEKSTIEPNRRILNRIFDEHLPPIRPDMTLLDLACGTGAVTMVLYERCRAQGLAPPQVIAADIGPNFIEAFNKNKKSYDWHTAKGIICDASNLEKFADAMFDVVVMNFGLFAVKDAVADKVTTEIHRVLKPGGCAVFTIWKETWVTKLFVGAAVGVGRPPEEVERFKMGRWTEWEFSRDLLVAGGFKSESIHHTIIEDGFPFQSVQSAVDQFDTPFWKGMGTSTWTNDQKSHWRTEVEKLITEDDMQKGVLSASTWVLVAGK